MVELVEIIASTYIIQKFLIELNALNSDSTSKNEMQVKSFVYSTRGITTKRFSSLYFITV